MAKIKVRPHPGALSGLLKRKSMTQVDAAVASRVDRKTLAKIERGEEVKKETLQKLASGLLVPVSFFEPPETESTTITKLTEKDPEWDAVLVDALIMLRELDAEGLSRLLDRTQIVFWAVNLQVVDEKVHELLERFDKAVHELHQHLIGESLEWKDRELFPTGLSRELSALKKGRAVANLMKQLAEHRIAVLGADYLRWTVSKETEEYYPDLFRHVHKYTSTPIVRLSIEKSGVRTRREPIWIGSEPPKYAPKTDPPTYVFVNSMQLAHPDDEIPF
jgi:transcriptional regulator with XRE-family HTH domain